MKKIIAVLLVVTMLFTTCAITVSAAGKEEFISEVALIYEDSVEEAKKAIAGTDWKLFEQDLNANADYMIDDGVYLIYKTTTDVEDAITDLRIMDMYGGFSTSNYESQLEKTRSSYLEVVKELRIAATEFKACYDAGSEMALLAYRQMNYYKDVKTEGGTETGMLMGDFFLNMPSDEEVVQVLMEGNIFVVNNLISLLAVGISSEGASTLASRVADQFAVKDTLTDAEYYDAAVVLSEIFTEMRTKILRYDALKEDHNLEDEDITEEEYQFMIEYASIAVLLEGIQLGETTLADLLRGGVFTEKDFYPIAAALTEGQKALVNMGQLEIVLKYNSPSSAIEDLEAMLDEIEKPYLDENGVFKAIDVYTGVDRSIFSGNFAMTTEAVRQQALTGETWDLGKAAGDSVQMYAVAGMFVVAECVLVGTMIGHNMTISSLALLVEENLGSMAVEAAYKSAKATWANFAPAVKGMSIGVALIIVGLVGISTWYNYYNPSYTAIPNTMIDVRETDLGDKYIKYTAAKVFENGRLSKKNADFNAYEGREWNALYYTKDATAGNCLTPNFVFSDSSSAVARRHQGVSMFGETNAFNLNSHVYSSNAKGAYLTVRYSPTKKTAADVPDVVGSMFSDGAFYAITALAGVCVGAGGTVLLQKGAKAKKKETA